MKELREIPNERDLPDSHRDARRNHLMNEISTQTTGWHNMTYRRMLSGVAAVALIAAGGIVVGTQTSGTSSHNIATPTPTVPLDAKTLLAASKDAVSKNKIIHSRTTRTITQLKGSQTVHQQKSTDESWLNPVHTEEGRTRSYDNNGKLVEEWGTILLANEKSRVVDVNYVDRTINDSIEKSLADESVENSPLVKSAARLFMDEDTAANAKIIGTETINGIQTTHISGYSNGPLDGEQATEDIWIADDTNFPVRKTLRSEGPPSTDDANPYGATVDVGVETTDYDVQSAPADLASIFLPAMPEDFTKSVDDASNY
jgi:hypothetical protein